MTGPRQRPAPRPGRAPQPPVEPHDPAVRRALGVSERAAARAALRVLRRRLGVFGAAAVLSRMAFARAAGEPFAILGPPRDEAERLARRQCASIVLLERAVAPAHGPALGLELAREVAHAGGAAYLGAMIPRLDARGFRRFAHELSGHFFNATGTGSFTGDGTFRFDVSRCRFVELLTLVGARHLAPLFCEVDRDFFDGERRLVRLTRTQTLAGGAASCDFRFRPGGNST